MSDTVATQQDRTASRNPVRTDSSQQYDPGVTTGYRISCKHLLLAF